MSADIEALRGRAAELRARFESYGGGDRPMSPPVSLMRELREAEQSLAKAADEERAAAFMSADVGELQRMLAEIPASESANRASLQARLSETQEALAELERYRRATPADPRCPDCKGSLGLHARECPARAPSRPRDTAPAWAAIGEIAAAVGLGEDASTQEVIDAVKRRAITKAEAREIAIGLVKQFRYGNGLLMIDRIEAALLQANGGAK